VIEPVVLQVLGKSLEQWLQLAIAGFAGGAFGAAIGALPVFIFTGFLVVAGEAANLGLAEPGAVGDPAALGAAGLTGSVAFGPVFGPHTSFAGGVAAAAYAARKGYMDTGFDYHEAKNIPYALGTKPDVLAVGGAFGILGVVITNVSVGVGAPWDPIAMGVTLGALFHRLILGYSIIGKVRGSGIFDMSPFERGEKRAAMDGGEAVTDGGSARLAVEPWLPHQYKWGNVAMLGLVTGLLAAWIGLITGSYFLGFGISAASLVFLNCGVEQCPVTHHITLPAATAAVVVTASSGSAPLAGAGVTVGLVVGGIFGVYGALLGEAHQRIFYAHGDTHWDPPAASIVATTFTIALLALAGVFPSSGWVPLP
jgi:hypothetical protein